MDKQLKVTLLLSAIDKVSSVVNKVTDNASKGFTRLQKESDKIAKSAANVGKQAGVAGLAITAPLIIATKEAIKFEDKIADVAKVMNLEAGSAGLKKVNDEVKKLSVYLAQTPEDTAELYANIAQGGVAAAEVGKVSKIAGEIGIAFGISAGQAGESFIKLSNSMAMTIDDTKKVTDALNHLGNNTASNSAELFEFLSSGGAGAARNLNLAGQEAAAFGSVLIANGKSASEAGTIFERMMKGIMGDKDMKGAFDKAGGGLSGVMAIMEKGASLNPAKQFEFFSKFGMYGTDISMFSKNLGQLKNTLHLVGNEANYADSSNAEFLNRQKTMATTLQRVKTQATILAVTIGEKMMPIIARLAEQLMPLIDRLAAWIDQNPALVEGIVKGAAGLAAFLLATSGVSYAVSGIATAVKMLSGAFAFLAANPIVLIIIAIAGAIFLIYKNWGSIVGFFKGIWDKVIFIFKAVFDAIKFYIMNFTPLGWIIRLWKPIAGFFKAIWDLVKTIIMVAIGVIKKIFLNFTPIGLIIKHWDKIADFFKGIWEKVKGPFMAIFNWVTSFGKRFFKAGANIIQNIIDGISSKINAVTDKIKGVTKKIRDYFPFSPAKAGPLMDIHRIKLMETVAGSIKPGPVMKAVQGVTQQVRGAIPKMTGVDGLGGGAFAGASVGGGGGAITVNFSPTITLGTGTGASAKEDFMAMLKSFQPELVRMIEDALRKNDRKKF